MEREFETKVMVDDKDWMAKNKERVQTFEDYKITVRNWDINECIILQMWDQQEDEERRKQEQ